MNARAVDSSEAGEPADAEVNQLIAEYLRRKDLGEAVDVESLCAERPRAAAGLRSYIAGEEIAAGLGPSSIDSSRPGAMSETIRPGASRGTDPAPAMRTIGRYRILRELGAGAMGAVYLAEDTSLGRQVALKMPKISGDGGKDFLDRFYREARTAATLSHANICPVYDIGDVDGVPYITMGFIEGQPLSRFVGAPEFRDQRRVAAVVRMIALALHHAHSKGVIHRDLKPGNVLMNASGQPIVTDFGLARRVDQTDESRLTMEGAILGTPAYMSPEQVEGDQSKIGPASDLYALGVMLYELLTMALPFKGSIAAILAQIVRDQPKVPSELRPEIDPELEDLCLCMMEKDASKRPGSMKDVADRLERWLRSTSPKTLAQRAQSLKSKEQYAAARERIEDLLKRGQFAKAMQALEKLAQLSSPEGEPHAVWAREKLPQVRALPQKIRDNLPALVATAKELLDRHDYGQAAEMLQQLPQEMRSPEIQELIDKATELQDEADLLLCDLKECVQKRQYAGIQENLKRFLELKPGNKFAKELQDALSTYSRVSPKARKYRHDDKGRLLPASRGSLWDNWLLWGGICFVVVFGAMWYGAVIYLRSNEFTLEVAVDDELLASGAITLAVDGEDYVISSREFDEVKITPKEHTFEVRQGTAVIHEPRTFTVEKEGRKLLEITRSDLKLVSAASRPGIEPAARAAAAENSPPPSSSPIGPVVSSDVIDLLAAVDPAQIGDDDAEWERVGKRLIGKRPTKFSGMGWVTVQFPPKITGDYDFELDFKAGHVFPMQIHLPLGSTTIGVMLSGSGSALHRIDNKSLDEVDPTQPKPTIPFPTGKVQRFVASVRHDGANVTVDASLDGTRIGRFSGARSRVSLPNRATTYHDRVNITSHGPAGQLYVDFHRVVVKPVASDQRSPQSRIPADAVAFGGRAYKHFNEQLSWTEAKRRCEEMGGRLPIVRSAAENDFLLKLPQLPASPPSGSATPAVWIGTTDAEQEGIWRWVDGSRLGYTNWGRNQPNNKGAGEHYAVLLLSAAASLPPGVWSDQPDVSTQHALTFICEWDTSNPATSSSPDGNSNWQDLFNGRDTTGWVRHADGQPVGDGWSVEDGALRLNPGGGNIRALQEYGDFELEFEWKIAPRGNSGVLYRVSPEELQPHLSGPEFQIGENHTGSGVGKPHTFAGSIFGVDGPSEKSDRPAGEWNASRIIARGDHLEHWLNGDKVAEAEINGAAWKEFMTRTNWPKFGQNPQGAIVLQDHGSPVWFRSVRIRELSLPNGVRPPLQQSQTQPPPQTEPPSQTESPPQTEPPPARVPAPQAVWSEWTDLFNGRDLTGWRLSDNPRAWQARAGVLSTSGPSQGFLITTKEYSDFELSLDYRLHRGANSGIHFRCLSNDEPGTEAVELQLIDNSALNANDLANPKVLHGALWNLQGPAGNPISATGRWVSLVMRLVGDRLTVTIDEKPVQEDVDLAQLAKEFPKFSGLKRTKGYIALQHWGEAQVDFRKIRIRELTAAPPAPAPQAAEPQARGARGIPFPREARFTSARPLTELNQGAAKNAYPWLSPDGLTIYWTREDADQSFICQASRKTPADSFTEIRPVLAGGRLATVSPDGLQIVCLFDGDGDGRPEELCTSRRRFTGVEFPPPRPIPEFRSLQRPKGSAFGKDDDEIFLLAVGPEGAPAIYHSTRAGVAADWSPPKRVTVVGALPSDHWLTHPSIIAGGKHLLFSYSESTSRPVEWGGVADQSGDASRFESARPLLLDGTKFITRGPRYCSATGELFYTHCPGDPPFETHELWVARAVQ